MPGLPPGRSWDVGLSARETRAIVPWRSVDTPRRDDIRQPSIPAQAIVAPGTAAGGGLVIDPGRLMRAVHLEAKPIDVDTWRVRGGTRDHMVTIEHGRCYCDCPDAQARDGDACKHAVLVRLRAGDGEVVRALRQLIPAPHWPKAKA